MPVLRLASCLLACLTSAPAWALDPDILINDQARREAVAPLCRALVTQPAEGTPEHAYQKGLCLLYGLHTPPQMPLALALLRQAAGGGWAEARLALADTLQQSNDADQREAMRWYATALAAGDVRASGRLARLTQRRNALQAAKAQAEATVAPQSREASQAGNTDDPQANAPGYHCHFSGFGKKFCHSTFD